MPSLRPPRPPRTNDDPNFATSNYSNPLPPVSGAGIGPVPLLTTNNLPLPPLGGTSRANAIPPLQKITVQQPQAMAMPAMPSLTGRPMGSQALSDAFRYRFMNRIAAQMDPSSSFDNELAAAQQSKAIHDLVYPPQGPEDLMAKAQQDQAAKDYARSLIGLPPEAVANAQTASDKVQKYADAAAAKAQAATDKAQKAADQAQADLQAKRMNPAAHYLATPEGIQQYSDDFNLNLSPDDVQFLDAQGRRASAAASTNAPSAYWNAVGPTPLTVDVPGAPIVDPQTGQPILDASGQPTFLPPDQAGTPNLDPAARTSVLSLLQSPRFAQAYGGVAEGGMAARGLAKSPEDDATSNAIPSRRTDFTPTSPQFSPSLLESYGLNPNLSDVQSSNLNPLGLTYPSPNPVDVNANYNAAYDPNASTLPLPPGGSLPNQPPDLRTQVTHALQGGAVAGGLVALTAVVAKRLGLDPLKSAALAGALVAGGDVATEQNWVEPAINAFGQTVAKPGQFVRAGLGALNPRDPAQMAANLILPGAGGLVASQYEGLINAYKQADPTLPPLQRFDQAIQISQKPFEAAVESVAKPLETNPTLGVAAPFVAGAVRTAAYAGTDPLMYMPGAIGKMAVQGMIVGGLGGLLQSSMTGGTSEQQAQAVQSGADIGMMVGPALAHGVPALRKLIARGEVEAPAVAPTEPAAAEAGIVPEATAMTPPRPIADIQADFTKAEQNWGTWLTENPDVPETEIENHPSYQQMQSLVDEMQQAKAAAPQPAAGITPPEAAVAPEVVPTTPPIAPTGPLLHPVTGQNLATGDLVHNTEVSKALDELHAAGDDARAAKTKATIKKSQARIQTAAEAFVGRNDPAGAQAIIDAEMGRAATPAVAPVTETQPATPSPMDDILAEQAATPFAGYQRPDLEGILPTPNSLSATPDNDPLLKMNTEGVMGSSGLSSEWYRPAPRGPYGGAQGGWKLHVSVGGDLKTTDGVLSSQEKNYRTLSDYLASKGIEHKVGHGGSHNEGKGMTIYVGARDDAMKVAEDLNSKFGKIIAKVPRETAKVYDDDVPFVGNIMGRFDAQGTKPTPNAPTGYAPYGAKGMSVEKNLLNNQAFTPGGIPTYEQDAYNALAKDYGSFFTGTESPFIVEGITPTSETFASQPELTSESGMPPVESTEVTPVAQPEVASLAAETTVAPSIETATGRTPEVIQAEYRQARSDFEAWHAQNPQATMVHLIPEFQKMEQLGKELDALGNTTASIKRPPSVTAKLPAKLVGANTPYNFGSKKFTTQFDSDVDKALYIVAQKIPSKHDADYLAWLHEQLPDKSDTELRAMGQTVRSALKAQAAVAPSGSRLRIEPTVLYSGVHPTVMAQGLQQIGQGIGAVNKLAHKYPLGFAGATAVGMTLYGAYARAQQKAKTGQDYGPASNDPNLNRIATFGGGAIQPRDFMEGSGLFGDDVALPLMEVALETVDMVPWGIAKLFGSDPSKTKGGIFNTQHTLAWVGDVFGGPTDNTMNLYDGLRKRSQEYKIDQPLVSFVASLPFDPLNWLGWGVAEKSAPDILRALADTSVEGRAARIAVLENPKLAQVPRLSSGNPLDDRFFAMTAGPRAIWNWSSQLSRASRMSQVADEYARMAVDLAGSPNVRASSFLEDIASKMVEGKASGDEMSIANKIAQRPPVDENAVRHLAEDLGHRLDPNESIDPDLIENIASRVESKYKWTPEDVSWLKDQFDALRPLENAVANNVNAWRQGLNGAGATAKDFEQLRRIFHIDPRITWTTGKGGSVPERLKSTLEVVNQFLKDRPAFKPDGTPNALRPSDVSFLGKVLGRQGWGLTQDTRINAWAAKYGLPDLGPAIEKSKGMSMLDFGGIVSSAVRRNFPLEEAPLRSWLEAHSFTMRVMNTWDRTGQFLAPANKRVFLPLQLSFLTALGFPVHIARTLSQRNPEVTLRGAGDVLGAGAGIGGVLKEAAQTGFGTSAYRKMKGLPQGPGFVAPVIVQGVKSELGNLAFWHNAELISETYLGDYGRSFLYGGHASMLGLPTDTNPVSEGIWPIGRWAGPLTLGDDLKAEAKLRTLNLSRERAALVTPGGLTVEQAAQVPVNPLNTLMNAGADIVHNANIGSVFGVTSHMVAQQEQAFRMGFVAWQHPIVYKQVLATLDESARMAQAALDRIAVRPAGLTDDAWKRVRSLFELKGSSGKLQQLVGTAMDGTVDRNAFAQAAFQEPDLPEFAKSELWGVLSKATPADLTTIFAKGGYADQMLEKVLQQTYSGRVTEALNQTVAELTSKLEPLRAAIKDVERQQRVYQKAKDFSPELFNQHVRLTNQRDNLITESWKSIEGVLNDQMQVHHHLWEWAYDAKRYVPDGQKDQFFVNIQAMRQKLIKDGQAEASDAMQLWRQQVLRQGIPIPKDILESYNNIFEHIQGAFAASDKATQDAWAFTRSHKGPGSQAEVSAKWHEVWAQNDATWNTYRALRDSEQEKIFGRLKEYYTAKKSFSATDRADAAQEFVPRPITPVPDDVRIKAQMAMERLRGVADNFVKHPPMPEDQIQIIRDAAAKIDAAAAKMPQDQLAAIQHAHLATANLVMEAGNHRFLNYLNRNNFDQLMTKTLFPFWQYDAHGGAFYQWMLTHIPGSAESYAREIEDTKDSPQGAGYFTGDYGIFGNQISPNRGLWDYRVKSMVNFFNQNRPGGLQVNLQQSFNRVLSEGFMGAHVSPALSFPIEAALGSNASEMSWPPLVQMAQDTASQITGQPYQTDQFARRAIADALVAMNADPYHPTPDQYEAAVKQAALQDAAGNTMPMFTDVPNERIAQRADFAKALTDYGYPPAVQQKWAQMHPGVSLFKMLDKEQGAKLMDDHPGWKYLFEASTASLPPEEMQQRMAISDQFEQLHKLTQDRLDDQAKYDAQVLGSKGKPATISPQKWMDLRGSRMDQYLGAKDQLTGQNAWKAINDSLNDPDRLKIIAEHPEDQAQLEYYALQADLIKKNTDDLGKINWATVTQGTDAFLNTLPPLPQSYVRNELVKNQTPVERTWHTALQQKQQYDAIPAWIGISPDQAVKKQAALTTLNQLLGPRGAGNAQRAAAFELKNRALLHAGKPNPARISFMLQPQNADYRFWFARATTKNNIANSTLDPSELAPWEYSPTVTGPLVAPDLNAAPDLAAAGG